jgi:GNAT superfamily N-acetyltransferase
VPEIMRLIRELADFEKLDTPGDEAAARMIQHGFETDPPKFEAWLANVPDRPTPVAYAIFVETFSSFLAKPTLYIEDIYVEEAFRNQGIGMALLNHAIDLARSRGCGRMEWTALDWNTNAQRVYEDKLGADRLSEWYLYRKVL